MRLRFRRTGARDAGPYRWLRHPNYMIVLGGVGDFAWRFAVVAIAVGFSTCNGVPPARRIRLEERALGWHSYHIRETLPHRK